MKPGDLLKILYYVAYDPYKFPEFIMALILSTERLQKYSVEGWQVLALHDHQLRYFVLDEADLNKSWFCYTIT